MMLHIAKKEISVKKPKEPIKTIIPPVKTRTSSTSSTTSATKKEKKIIVHSTDLENVQQKSNNSPAKSSKSTVNEPRSTVTLSKHATNKPKIKKKTSTSSSATSSTNSSSSKKVKTKNIKPKVPKTTKVSSSKNSNISRKTPDSHGGSTKKIEILKKSTPAKKKSTQKIQNVKTENIKIEQTSVGTKAVDENVENVEKMEDENEADASILDFKNSLLPQKPLIINKRTISELASLLNDTQILPVEKQSGIFEEIKEGQQKHNVGGRSIFRHRSSICLYKEGYKPGHALEEVDQPLITKNGRPIFHLALNESTASFLDNSRNASNHFLEMSSGLVPFQPKSKYNFSIPLDDTNDMSQTAAMLKNYIFDDNNEWNTSRTEPNHQDQQSSNRHSIPEPRLSLFGHNTSQEPIDQDNSFIIPSTGNTERGFFQSNNTGGRMSTRLSFLYNKNTGIICKHCFSSTCCHMEKFSVLATQNMSRLIDNSEAVEANSSDITPNRSTFRSESGLASFMNQAESVEELKEIFTNSADINNGNESMRLVKIRECSHTDQAGNVIPYQELQMELEMNFETSTPNDELPPNNNHLSAGPDMSGSELLYTPAPMKSDDTPIYSRPTTNETLQYDIDYDDASYLNAYCNGSANSTFEQLDVTTGLFFCNSQNNGSSEDVSADLSYDQLLQPDILTSSSSFSNNSSNNEQQRQFYKIDKKGAKRKLSLGVMSNLDTVFEGEECSARSLPSTGFAALKNTDFSGLQELLETVDAQLSSRSNDSDGPLFSDNKDYKNPDDRIDEDDENNKPYNGTNDNGNNNSCNNNSCNNATNNTSSTNSANTSDNNNTGNSNNNSNSSNENKEEVLKYEMDQQNNHREFILKDFAGGNLDDEELKIIGSDKNSDNNNSEIDAEKESTDTSEEPMEEEELALELLTPNANNGEALQQEKMTVKSESNSSESSIQHEPHNENQRLSSGKMEEQQQPRSFRRIQDKDEEILQYLDEDSLQLWLQANRKNCFENDFFKDDVRYNSYSNNNTELLPEDKEVLEINTPEWEKILRKESVVNTDAGSETDVCFIEKQPPPETADITDSNPGTGNSSVGPPTQGSYKHIDLLVIDRPSNNINQINNVAEYIDTESNHSDSESGMDSGVHSTTNTIHSARTLTAEESDDNKNGGIALRNIDTLVVENNRPGPSLIDGPDFISSPERGPVSLPVIDSIMLAKKQNAYKNTRNRFSDSSDVSIPMPPEKFSYFDYPREITSPMLEHHRKMAQYHRDRIELLTPLVHGRDSALSEFYQPKPPTTPPHVKKSHKRKFAKPVSPPVQGPPSSIHSFRDNSSYLDNLNSISPRIKHHVPRPPPTFERTKRFTRKSNQYSLPPSLRKHYGNPYYDEPEYQDHVKRIDSRAHHINKHRQLMRRQVNVYTKTIDPKYDTTLYLTVPFRSLKQHPNTIYNSGGSNRPSL